ncbi:hypothetical protein VMCG_07076 [Cytospora schulzeri]|uniref:Major facilitator superfamily (MFS) profile domain-containing protein n=1 Tax=Cytospora schulzeri TaxID=448051 RepID=A0A423W3Z1_9PEZI|nr:hypothetical protein VMCG_07076 [Valsa malicola]
MSTVLTRDQPLAQKRIVAEGSGSSSGKDEPSTSTTSLSEGLNLGVPLQQKRFFWQRSKQYDPDAIATLPSVFDDPDTAVKYHPKPEWENYHRFDPSARWTWGEERKLVRKIDIRIMIFAIVMFMALEIDRSNLTQALTDDFLDDLHITTNDYNLGNTVFKLAFLLSELPSQLVSKWMGPDRWIPTQLTIWSIIILYLSYFYKHSELSIRLGYFWTGMNLADIISSFLAYGLLHMRGVAGYAGWRWLFLIEGVFTLIVGLLAYGLMPAGPCQTASWFRGKKGWFDEREQTIIVNRVIREEPSKSDMHNREPVTPKLLWQSLQDFDLWPLYLIGLVFQVPMTPESQYLSLTLKGAGFGTFETNLLMIPSYIGRTITMLMLTYLGEIWNELTFTAMIGQIWALPLLICMVALELGGGNRWVLYAVVMLIVSSPGAHPIQVGWNSRNANAVRSRTVSAACYNMFVQGGGIIASNIYRDDDKPLYRRGNKVLLGICCMNIGLYLLTKAYYVFRNKQRDKKWNALSEDERLEYLSSTTDQGNKRLDFRFQH